MSEVLSTGENDGVRISNQLMCTQSYSLMHTQSQSIHNMRQLQPSKDKENENYRANTIAQATNTTNQRRESEMNAFSPHSVAVSFLEDQSIPNQTNRKIVVNRITDLNNSASFSANKTAKNFTGLNKTSTDPFRSVDALGRKRRQINLSKTHCEL